MPLPPSRQYFGIGTKPVEEYFQPVVPEMGRRLSTGNKADIFMADRAINQLAQQYAMQDEALAQRQYDEDMRRRERAFGQRMQQEIGPELENQTIAQYRQKFATTADQAKGMEQKNRFLDAAAGIDVQSEEGMAKLEQIAAQNPYAMSDPDVQHYLRIRGYQPQDAVARQRAVRDYTEGLAPNERKYATGKTLPEIRGQVEFAREQQKLAMQLARMGVDLEKIDELKDETGAFDPRKVGKAMSEADLRKYDRPMTEARKAALLDNTYEDLYRVKKDRAKADFNGDDTSAYDEEIERLTGRIKQLSGRKTAADGDDESASPDAGKKQEDGFKVTDKTTKEEIAKLAPGTKIILPNGEVKYRK